MEGVGYVQKQINPYAEAMAMMTQRDLINATGEYEIEKSTLSSLHDKFAHFFG